MIAERAGQPLSLLVLDEIFGSLDEARRLHVVGLLRRLADRFPQVILITHIGAVARGLDRVIRVDFDPARGASVVRTIPPHWEPPMRAWLPERQVYGPEPRASATSRG